MQQGLYLGKSIDYFDFAGRHASVLVLENQEAWVLQQPAGPTTEPRVLFAQGTFGYTGPDFTFTQERALVSWLGAPLEQIPVRLTGSESTLKAVVPAHSSTTAPSATLATPATGYDYNRPARISDVLGAWQPRTSPTATFSIDDAGSVAASGLATGCSLAGAVVPRPGGKNVFNVIFTVADCAAAGAYTGVVVSYADSAFSSLSGALDIPTLRLMGIDQGKTKAYSLVIDR